MNAFWIKIGALGLCLGLLSGCSPSSTIKDLSASFASFTPATKGVKADAPDVSAKDLSQPERAYVSSRRTELADRKKINRLIAKYARAHNLPVHFVHRVVNRESTYKSHARNGIHLGLMQLNPQTARTMGYRGPDNGLLNAETNLKYGVKYLAGAYMVADGNEDHADKLYQTGYYYHAKRRGMLQATGLRP